MPLNLSIAAKEEPKEVLRFDYSQIEDEESRNALMGAALAIKPLLRRAAGDIVQIGLHLIEVKNESVPGGFMAWVDAEFEMTYRTAKRFMEVAERLGDRIDNLSTLPVSALYMLARPSTPDEAIGQVESLVAGGEKPSLDDVEQISRNGKASYWSPSFNAATAEVEQPQAKQERADPSLGEDEALRLIKQATAEVDDHPEIEEYAAGTWSLWLHRNAGQWPPIQSCRLALRKLIRELKAQAGEKMGEYFEAWMQESGTAEMGVIEQIEAMAVSAGFQKWLSDHRVVFDREHAAAFVRNRRDSLKRGVQRPLTVEETKAAIVRWFERNNVSSMDQFNRLRSWTFEFAQRTLAPVIQEHLYVDEGAFLTAKISLLEDFREALGIEDEQPQPQREELSQAQKDANAAFNKSRQTKSLLSEHIRLALGHLPEAREDDYYDLTGLTTYSDARRKLIQAMHELEQTLEAIKEV